MSSGYPIREPYLKGSYGVQASGYRQFTPAFGLGVELGYSRYGVGDFTCARPKACCGYEQASATRSGELRRTVSAHTG